MPDETQDPRELNEPQGETAEEVEASAQEPAEEVAEEVAQEAVEETAPAAGDADAPARDEPQAPEPTETDAEAAEGEGQQEQEKKGPDYGVSIEDAGELKKAITVTIPATAIAAKRDELFGELSTSAQVPGFRIGHAPRRLLEKRFGKEVAHDVRNAVIGDALGAVLKKSDLKAVGEPDLDLDEIKLPDKDGEDMSFTFQVEVAPEFELPSLEGLAIEKPVLEVNDERIDEAIERMRLSAATHELTDDAAAERDVIVGDATITGDGIDEPKKEVILRVAPGQIDGLPLVDLGKELAGKKAGETVTLTVGVPSVHPNEAWRGKQATIDLAVREVRRRVLPEVNDEFARSKGCDSVEDLREDVAERMAKRIEFETKRAMRNQVHEYLLSNTEFDVPEDAQKRHADRLLVRRYVDLLQAGRPQEEIDEHLTEIKAGAAADANTELKLAFMLKQVADDLGIEVAEEEVNARVAELARSSGRRPERLRQELTKDGSLGQVKIAIREEKALDAVLAKAVITEVTPQAARAGADAASAQDAESESPEESQGDSPEE